MIIGGFLKTENKDFKVLRHFFIKNKEHNSRKDF